MNRSFAGTAVCKLITNPANLLQQFQWKHLIVFSFPETPWGVLCFLICASVDKRPCGDASAVHGSWEGTHGTPLFTEHIICDLSQISSIRSISNYDTIRLLWVSQLGVKISIIIVIIIIFFMMVTFNTFCLPCKISLLWFVWLDSEVLTWTTNYTQMEFEFKHFLCVFTCLHVFC